MADGTTADSIKLLIASDLHLGYAELDPIRGNDSFDTFDEILGLANQHQVDMVLISGNLFHENNPSRYAMHMCSEKLRRAVWGPRPVQVEFRSDPNTTFHDSFRQVNYEILNANIQLPVFAIHGSKDDPSGHGDLSALDTLSINQHLNYFGRVRDLSENSDVKLHPIFLSKGSTKLALYGLGHMREETFQKILERKKVRAVRPVEEPEKWFNVMAVHQKRSGKSESQLPSCMDIVVWGHEHRCEIASGLGNTVAGNHFVVIQPGSTVATSLVEDEAEPKYVSILEIRGDQYKFSPIKLETVRPFIFKDIVLQQYEEKYDFNDESSLTDFLKQQVELVLAELKERHPVTPTTTEAENRLEFPLVRLRVDYSGYSTTCNPQRFGQPFVKRVANPSELLTFTRKPKPRSAPADEVTEGAGRTPDDDPWTIIHRYLAEELRKDKMQLRVLSVDELNTGVFEDYVKKEDRNAIAKVVEHRLQLTRRLLRDARAGGAGTSTNRNVNEAMVEHLLSQHAAEARERTPATAASATGTSSGSVPQPAAFGSADLLDVESDEEVAAPPPRPLGRAARGRGRGAGRGGRARGAGAGERGSRGGRGLGATIETVAARPGGEEEIDGAAPGRKGGSPAAGMKWAPPPDSVGTPRAAPKRRAATTARASFAAAFGESENDDADMDVDVGASAMKSSSSGRSSFSGKRQMK